MGVIFLILARTRALPFARSALSEQPRITEFSRITEQPREVAVP